MWQEPITPDELYHHGILGMKWGVRRYQNPDGTLTAAGRNHYNYSNMTSSMRGGSKGSSNSSSRGGGNPQNNNFSNVSRNASTISNESAKIGDIVGRNKKQKVMDAIDVSGMTNKELSQAIRRIQLETQYKDLMSSDIDRGYQRVTDILTVAGSVAAIGAAAATIYAILRK